MKVNNILIVDDDSEDSEFFTMVVNKIDPDINIMVACSRDELFEQLNKTTPDLLFIDSFIQHHSGVSSIMEIRKDQNWKNLPVIMYTGATDRKNISNAFKAGACAYIVKPATIHEIQQVLQEVLQKDWKQKDLPKQYYIENRFKEYIEPV
jgi:response regulator of citrate/malate metabolism